MLRVDGSFQIFDRINDNTYKVDIPSEYGVNVTFNTFFISFYLMGDDSWMDHFKKRGDNTINTTLKDLLQVLIRSITRSITKRLKDTFNGLIQSIWAKMNFIEATSSTSDDQTLVNLISLHLLHGPINFHG